VSKTVKIIILIIIAACLACVVWRAVFAPMNGAFLARLF
jgi:hypothetical protein